MAILYSPFIEILINKFGYKYCALFAIWLNLQYMYGSEYDIGKMLEIKYKLDIDKINSYLENTYFDNNLFDRFYSDVIIPHYEKPNLVQFFYNDMINDNINMSNTILNISNNILVKDLIE